MINRDENVYQGDKTDEKDFQLRRKTKNLVSSTTWRPKQLKKANKTNVVKKNEMEKQKKEPKADH